MPSKVIASASSCFEVPFHDADAMQVVWHGHYVKYLEIARCALLDTFNYNYLQMQASGYFWPIVDMRIKYVGSAKFFRDIEVVAELIEVENRMKIDYRIYDKQTGDLLTKAYTVQVAVGIESGEMQFESPPVLAQKLAEANLEQLT